MAFVRLMVNTNTNDVTTKLVPFTGGAQRTLKLIEQLFRRFVRGVWNSNVSIMTGGVQATDTVTFASFANADTVTINGVVLTGKTSPSGTAQFAVGASNAECAVNFRNCINAHPSLSLDIIASTVGTAVVTLTSRFPGIIGNLMTAAISARGSVGGANFTGGTQGSGGTISHGV